MKTLINWWKANPKVRFGARTVGAAVAGYVVQTIQSGDLWTWQSLASGAGTAAITAGLGIFGLEPFVGFFKPKSIEVPAPPAVPDK